MWYHAESVAGSSGDEITSWDDSGPNGWTLVGSSGSSPYLTNSSEINGKKWLSFDGSNDFLKHGHGSLSQPTTVFALVKFDGLPAASASVLDGTNASTRMLLGITSAGAFQISGGTSLSSSSSLVQAGHWVLLEATFNGSTTSDIRTNAAAVQTGDAGTQAASGLYVGQRQAGGRYLDGGPATILIYQTNLASTDRASIRAWVTNTFGAYETW